ncbi:transcriptional regulator [Chryseobacterium shandongense]|jgi:predicted transcriptional regulator|uniref:Transcriptional regulator n=1 Tax=Chryseobacterium shandongense TaxID=1493872 RepID=A0AAD0Y8W3_9FLAO|nr:MULTISPECIES: BlaI/MecI/CopY family transcriptional regulator [Chryseobacterium]AZA85721.1 transcriptional regulator [Chryseobacterium shandongense]AZA94127.1 transcriptional regulator [Chryseobacterium shandongense]
MKINHLTSAEENLMRLLWRLGSFYLKDIMEQHPEPKPHQNTVSTYLKILIEKGYLSTEKEGRIFRYHIMVPVENYRKFLLTQLSDNFFNGSGKEIISFMIHEHVISAEDLNDFNSNLKPAIQKKEPEFEYANEVLNTKKEKKKSKDKKKKKKKEKE